MSVLHEVFWHLITPKINFARETKFLLGKTFGKVSCEYKVWSHKKVFNSPKGYYWNMTIIKMHMFVFKKKNIFQAIWGKE